MYIDISEKDSTWPKNLIIRNHKGGSIWQVYHVNNSGEAEQLSSTAFKNGFYSITLEELDTSRKETWPEWRKTSGGKEIIKNSLTKENV